MNVRIRVSGTAWEIRSVCEALAEVLDVVEVSDFYPSRRRMTEQGRGSQAAQGRVYLKVTGVGADITGPPLSISGLPAAAHDDVELDEPAGPDEWGGEPK
jgi:hypothetical protein